MIPVFIQYLVEYDLENNVVYISGMDSDNFWHELSTQDDIAEPESYAWGYADSLKANGYFVEVENITE